MPENGIGEVLLNDQAGALHTGRVRSKFSVGQEVKKEIPVEEVAL